MLKARICWPHLLQAHTDDNQLQSCWAHFRCPIFRCFYRLLICWWHFSKVWQLPVASICFFIFLRWFQTVVDSLQDGMSSFFKGCPTTNRFLISDPLSNWNWHGTPEDMGRQKTELCLSGNCMKLQSIYGFHVSFSGMHQWIVLSETMHETHGFYPQIIVDFWVPWFPADFLVKPMTVALHGRPKRRIHPLEAASAALASELPKGSCDSQWLVQIWISGWWFG